MHSFLSALQLEMRRRPDLFTELHRVVPGSLIMRTTVVTKPDNRRDKGRHDSNFCKSSRDASLTLSHVSNCFLTRWFTPLRVAPVWQKRGLPSGQAELGLKSSD